MTVEKKYSFETPPDPIAAKDIKETINADIVVAGAGPAGLAAAVSAAEKGAKVVLLEKYHRIAAPGGPGAPFLGTKCRKKGKANQIYPPSLLLRQVCRVCQAVVPCQICHQVLLRQVWLLHQVCMKLVRYRLRKK